MLLNATVVEVFFGLILIWLVVLTVIFFKLFRHYQKLIYGITKKDLHSVLEKLLSKIEQHDKKIELVEKELEKFQKENLTNFQKIGFIRFNPFVETGGDQSFSLALLDGEDSGVVISSLHSRDVTRLYAKPVKKGEARGYQLSDEERRTIKEAKRIK